MMRRSRNLVTSQKMVRPNSSIVLGYKYLYLCTDIPIYLGSSSPQQLQKHSTELVNSRKLFFYKTKSFSLYSEVKMKLFKTEYAGLALHIGKYCSKRYLLHNDKGSRRGWMIF